MTHSFELIEDEIKTKLTDHVSGKSMVSFTTFKPRQLNTEFFSNLIEQAKIKFGPELNLIQICLNESQIEERDLLTTMGFKIDGFEFSLGLPLTSRSFKLPFDFQIRKMEYEKDIDAVSGIERRVHAADPSSRVNFDTKDAFESMKRHYKIPCEGLGVYLLIDQTSQKIAGFVGFLASKLRKDTVLISSIAMDIPWQGKKIMLPFLHTALKLPIFHEYKTIVGLTTTSKLLTLAKRLDVPLSGISMISSQNL